MTPWTRHVRIGGASLENVQFSGFPERVVIYGVYGPQGIIYVGSTETPIRQRVRDHVLRAMRGSDTPLHVWMRSVAYAFDVRFLAEVPAEDRVASERAWVAMYPGQLLNVTDGGPGMSGHKFSGSDHARKIGERQRLGSNCTCETCEATFWRKPRDIRSGNNRFCSRACYQVWQRGRSKVQSRGAA